MAKLHIGIAGAGIIAREHALSFHHNPAVASFSVFDVDPARAKALAEPYGGTVVNSLAELIAGCDLLWIATPPPFHAEAVEQAAAAGRAIFCEKPLALNEAHLQRIEAAVASSGVPFYMGQSGRWSDPFRQMQRLAAEGLIGDLVQVWSVRQGYLDRKVHPPWRFDDAASGGVGVEFGVHEIDFIRWVGGEWSDITAVGSGRALAPGKFTDTIAAVGRLSSGADARLSVSWAEPRYLWQRGVLGTRGSLFIDDMRFTKLEHWEPGATEPKLIDCVNWKHEETGENMALREQLQGVVDAIDGRIPFPVSLADGAAAVRAAFAMQACVQKGGAK